MEAGATTTGGTAAPPATGDLHGLLDQVDEAYHAIYAGHVPDEVHRFEQFLSTVRMIVDQSADSASKE